MVVSTSAGIGKGAYRRLLESRPLMRALVVIVIALALVGTATAAPRIVGIGEQKDGENAKAHVGDTLVVTLGANKATGSWKVAAVNRALLHFDSSGYVPAAHAPLAGGAVGVAVLTFKVVARGNAILKLNYVSAAKKVTKTFSVKINVVAPGV
jgi:predicted secreted protein